MLPRECKNRSSSLLHADFRLAVCVCVANNVGSHIWNHRGTNDNGKELTRKRKTYIQALEKKNRQVADSGYD